MCIAKHSTRFSGWSLFLIAWALFLQPCGKSPAADLKITADVKINDDAGATQQTEPRIAMNDLGQAVIAWRDERDGTPDIYFQIVGYRGFFTKGNLKVNEQPIPAGPAAADAAINDCGHFVVVWESRSDSARIQAQRFAANGEKIGPAIAVARTPHTAYALSPAIAMDARGNFIVCWSDRSQSDGDIFFRRFDHNGVPRGNAVRANQVSQGRQIYPCIDFNGRLFVIAWIDGRSTREEIFAQRYQSNGTPLGGNLQVSHHNSSDHNPGAPALALQLNDEFMVTWPWGAVDDIYAASFDAAAAPLSKVIAVSDTLVHWPTMSPDICTLANGNYGIAWTQQITAAGPGVDPTSAVFFRYYDRLGQTTATAAQISETATILHSSHIAASGRIGMTAVFSDRRSGNYDIRASWTGPKVPLNLHAGSGFNGIIPITWDFHYGRQNISKYKILRRTGANPYAEIASIDLKQRGAAWTALRDWIDATVTPGTTYAYVVQAAEGSDTNPSAPAIATAGSARPQKRVPWVASAPLIDGILQPGEWSDAETFRIDQGEAFEPILLSLQHNYPMLYFAVDDPNDPLIDPGNLFALLFDLDNTRTWDASAPSQEGLIAVHQSGMTFTGYWGAYPNALGADATRPAAGITRSITTLSGHVQYEIAIDCSASPLNLKVGQPCGAAFWVVDPGSVYGSHYGNAGEWPANCLWECALTLGELLLEPRETTGDRFAWPMADGGANRRAYALAESSLLPPFSSTRDYLISGNNADALAIAFNTLVTVATGHETAGENALHAFHTATGDLMWRFVIPGSVGSLSNYPCISESLVVIGAQGSPRLHALGRMTGVERWHRDSAEMRNAIPITDGEFLYFCSDSLYGLELLTGNRVWSAARPRFDNAICIDDNNLYWVDGLHLRCLDKFSGALNYQMENSGQLSIIADEVALYTVHDNHIVAREKRDGALKWQVPRPAGSSSGIGRMMMAAENTLCVRMPNYNRSTTLFAIDKNSGALRWQRSWDSTVVAPPAGANGLLYLAVSHLGKNIPYGETDELMGLDIMTGDTLFHLYDSYWASPVVAEHQLFAAMTSAVRAFGNGPSQALRHDAPPSDWGLAQNYPNPFNPATQIVYWLGKADDVEIAIFNIRGGKVKTLAARFHAAGRHEISWNGMDDRGQPAGSGFYLMRMKCGDVVQVRKMLLLR